MYAVHGDRKEILSWCYTADQGQKWSVQAVSSDEPNPKRSRYDKQIDKMTEVEHSDSLYSEEQLRYWAHLIQMRKHSSLDVPPDKPFWKNRSKKFSDSTATPTGGTSITVSPSKRVNLRGQCVQQLLQLHE